MQPHLTRTIQRSYKTELDPTPAQREACLRHAGCARFVYNWALTRKQEIYRATGRSVGSMALHAELTKLKQTEYIWLNEVSCETLSYALRNLDAAYANFYRRYKTGDKTGFPRYKNKKRDGIGSFKLRRSIYVESRRIKLPIIGWVRLKESDYLPLSGVRIRTACVSEQAGRWYVSIQVEQPIDFAVHNNAVVGVDLGCDYLATLSDGTVYENPKPLKRYRRKLRRANQALSRKQIGSANRQKARRRYARINQRVANIRKNALHQATTAIAKQYGIVVMENLNVAGLLKNSHIGGTISDVGMAMFKRQMAYKLDWAGGQLILADRFFPSSKNCSACGAHKGTLTLKERLYHCESCSMVMDRDLNAARNLAKIVAGKSSETQNACGERVRPDSIQAMLGEAGIPLREDWDMGTNTAAWLDEVLSGG